MMTLKKVEDPERPQNISHTHQVDSEISDNKHHHILEASAQVIYSHTETVYVQHNQFVH